MTMTITNFQTYIFSILLYIFTLYYIYINIYIIRYFFRSFFLVVIQNFVIVIVIAYGVLQKKTAILLIPNKS